MASPLSEDGTLLVSMLSVMMLNMLSENIMGTTVRHNWNTVCILACGGEGTRGLSVVHHSELWGMRGSHGFYGTNMCII